MVLSEALTPVLAAIAGQPPPPSRCNATHPRERDILKLIARGLPNKMIARRLDMSPKVRSSAREGNICSENEAEIARGGRRLGTSGTHLLIIIWNGCQCGLSSGIVINGSVSAT